jgi:hypothetical protein
MELKGKDELVTIHGVIGRVGPPFTDTSGTAVTTSDT